MLFRREFIRSLRPLVIWTAILGGLLILTMSLYPEVAKQQKNLMVLFKDFPKPLLKAFNIGKLSFSTALEYYAIKGYMLVTLGGSIYAVIMASSILAKEEGEKTIEFLLAKPITRTQIVTRKLLALLANLALFDFIITVLNYIGFKLADKSAVALKPFLLISIAPFLLHLTFAAVSYLISSIGKRSRTVLPFTLGMVFISYFLSIMAEISDKFKNLKYFTPFEYANAADIILTKQIRPLYIFIMLALIIVSILATYTVYKKKDIFI